MQRFVLAKAKEHIEASTLVAASYWTGLRQAIYVAVTDREPLLIDTIQSLADRTFTEANDQVWANRAVVHCADVINLCFATLETSFLEKWGNLNAWNEEWRKRLPLSCSAIYSEPWEGVSGTLPKRVYRSGCHGMILP